jgi:hypothetical protein
MQKSHLSSNLIMHSKVLNNPYKIFKQLGLLFWYKRAILQGFFFFFNTHNLVRVCMECDYTHLNHNLLVSPKKMVTRGMIIKGVGLLC